jgi:hypothetical protein
MISRRGLICGIGALLAAPAIVRASSLMPISVPPVLTFRGTEPEGWLSYLEPGDMVWIDREEYMVAAVVEGQLGKFSIHAVKKNAKPTYVPEAGRAFPRFEDTALLFTLGGGVC